MAGAPNFGAPAFFLLPPSGEAKKYVILSASEISYDLSEKVNALRKSTLPGDCFVVSLPRNDK